MSFDLPRLTRAVAQHGRVARVVVIRNAGSVPRDAGTAMLIWADGQDGTIGGGALEWQATHDARALLKNGGRRRVQVPLGPGLGQCCGGAVTLAIEVFDTANLPAALPYARPLGPAGPMPPKVTRKLRVGCTTPVEIDGWLIEDCPKPRRPLWIYGAGHVGRALVHVMHPLPDLAITWVDIHANRYPEEIPDGVTPLIATNPARAAIQAPDHADHLILTYAHDVDLALCHALLRQSFNTIGLIGSATKWARFRNRLVTLGHSPAQIARIICPIGDPSLGKHPSALALGVATAFLAQTIATPKDLTG